MFTSYEIVSGPRTVEPYPGIGRGGYFHVLHINERLVASGDDAQQAAGILAEHIFASDPSSLDLPPFVNHRLQQALRIMRDYPEGEGLLQADILEHFRTAERQCLDGYALVPTNTLVSTDLVRPRPVVQEGRLLQPIALPPSVRKRGLVWNQFVQAEIEAGNLEMVFSEHPAWVAASKLADGSWLQAGNLMFEVGEVIDRSRTSDHRAHQVEERWGLDQDSVWGAGQTDWYVTTHIVDKELLELAARLDPSMIDGMRLTAATYVRSYRPILELIELNPALEIKGVISDGSWIYSDELKALFPHQAVSELHDVAGEVINLGPAASVGMPGQRAFATHNKERYDAAQGGQYKVTVAARFISPAAMRQLVTQYDV